MKYSLISFSILGLLSLGTQAQVNLKNGLFVHYALDNNAVDSATNPSNGTVIGATPTTDRYGNASKAYSFANTGDKISVPIASKLNFESSDSFTFSVWVKPTQTTSTNSTILNIYKLGGIEVFMAGSNRGMNVGKLCVVNYDGIQQVVVYEVFSDSVLAINQWQHILITLNKSTNTLKGYINGRLALNVSSPTFVFNSAGLTFGNHVVENWLFKGSIDDVRFYNRLLTNDEIKVLGSLTTGFANRNLLESPLTVYPNPSENGIFTIATDNDVYTLEVTDVQGKKVPFSQKGNTLDLSTNQGGIYILQIQDNKGEIAFKKLYVTH
jgi:hypothetical protein